MSVVGAHSSGRWSSSVTERELEREVRRLLEERGLYGYHAPDSRRAAAGFPDWVIIGKRGVLWRELKSRYGGLSDEQRRVGWLLRLSGEDWDVWRPEDFLRGRIVAQLDAITG